eukprot:PITA_19679
MRSVRKQDSIMVMVDRSRKVANFILVKITYSTNEVAQIFIREIVRLHGVPKKIVSDRGATVTSKFWKELFASLGIKLAFNTSYHPHTYGHIKRVNKILEYMLRMYMMHQQKEWEEYLPLVECTYKNGYQESLRISPFEALHGRSCNTPITWSDPVNMVLIGSDMLADMEQEMQFIKKNIKAPHDRQKSYVDQHRVDQEKEFHLEPQCILQWKYLMLRNKAIEKVKVEWKHFGPEEVTWEMADQMRALYP